MYFKPISLCGRSQTDFATYGTSDAASLSGHVINFDGSRYYTGQADGLVARPKIPQLDLRDL